jgi:hypothetical protein
MFCRAEICDVLRLSSDRIWNCLHLRGVHRFTKEMLECLHAAGCDLFPAETCNGEIHQSRTASGRDDW